MTGHGHFHWTEFVTRDPEGFKTFYARTVGWTYEAQTQPDGECYWVALANGEPVGGIPTNRPGLEAFPMAGCRILPSMTSMRASRRRWPPARN